VQKTADAAGRVMHVGQCSAAFAVILFNEVRLSEDVKSNSILVGILHCEWCGEFSSL